MRFSIRLILLLVIYITFLPASGSFALPQFSVEYKQSCQLCHQNPTGSGMRSLYGAQSFSYMELPAQPLDDFGKLDEISPLIGKKLQAGFDFRSIFYAAGQDSSGKSFLTMEGDLYLAFTPTDHTLLYIDRNLSGSGELFALIQGLPMSGAVRVGRIVPAYGWRFEDHKAYVQQKLGLVPRAPLSPDNGIEFGFYPMAWEFSAAITNGGFSPVDRDEGKALTTRAAGRTSIGALNLTGGVSYRYNELGRRSPLVRYAGAFFGGNYGTFTYLGETDWMGSDVTGLVTTHTASYRLKPGVNLSLAYDFYDPDLDVKAGTSWRTRLSSELYLTGYLELIPAFYWESDKTGPTGKEFGVGELQLHVWF